MTVLLWRLDYMSLTLLALFCMHLVSLAQLYIFVTWYGHCLHRPLILMDIIFAIQFLDNIHWVTHYFAFALINKINQAGVIEGDCSRRNPGRCAWKGDPLWVWMPHVILLFIRAPVITCYMIPEYSELFLPAIRIH